MLKENYELVDQKITEACKRAGRDRRYRFWREQSTGTG